MPATAAMARAIRARRFTRGRLARGPGCNMLGSSCILGSRVNQLRPTGLGSRFREMLVESTLRPSVMPRDVEAMSPLLRGTLSALRRWIHGRKRRASRLPTFEAHRSRVSDGASVQSFARDSKSPRTSLGASQGLGMTADGDTFQCRPPDLVQLYVWLFGVWEPDLTEFIRGRARRRRHLR